MRRVVDRRIVTWVVLIWTGVFAIAIIAPAVLNPGVTEEDIRECVAEGFIPPDECEAVLEAAEDTWIGIGVPALILVWLAGFLVLGLVWLLTRQRPASSH